MPYSTDETRVKEFGLKSMWRSPNGTIRNILNGLCLINMHPVVAMQISNAFWFCNAFNLNIHLPFVNFSSWSLMMGDSCCYSFIYLFTFSAGYVVSISAWVKTISGLHLWWTLAKNLNWLLVIVLAFVDRCFQIINKLMIMVLIVLPCIQAVLARFLILLALLIKSCCHWNWIWASRKQRKSEIAREKIILKAGGFLLQLNVSWLMAEAKHVN